LLVSAKCSAESKQAMAKTVVTRWSKCSIMPLVRGPRRDQAMFEVCVGTELELGAGQLALARGAEVVRSTAASRSLRWSWSGI